jgi:gliding motility-associated-like protein
MDTSLYDTLTDLRIVNCYKTEEKLVEDCPLVIPNVFTPDGDGYNDYFAIRKLNLQRENELIIYDRWRKNVFQQKNYKCHFKDSKYYNTEEAFTGLSRGGQNLPEGTYYYAFKYNAIPKKKAKTYTGIVTILRDNK